MKEDGHVIEIKNIMREIRDNNRDLVKVLGEIVKDNRKNIEKAIEAFSELPERLSGVEKAIEDLSLFPERLSGVESSLDRIADHLDSIDTRLLDIVTEIRSS